MLVDVKLLVPTEDIKDVNKAIKLRAKDYDWYVLRYDVKTTYYNNEIRFKNLEDAYKEFNETQPAYPDERVELIFAPDMSDPIFGDNIVINYKTFEA